MTMNANTDIDAHRTADGVFRRDIFLRARRLLKKPGTSVVSPVADAQAALRVAR
jgi:hypothetical protein